MKSKSTAAILAFFLGGIGTHLFYLGNHGRALFYLCFWALSVVMVMVIKDDYLLAYSGVAILGLMALIDFLYLISMSDTVFNDTYNSGYTTSTAVNVADEIAKLHELKEKGAISDEEFERHKKKLLE